MKSNISSLIMVIRQLKNRMAERYLWLKCAKNCLVDTSVKFTPSAQISNTQSKDTIQIGSNSLIMGQLLVTSESSGISVGEWVYVGPQTQIWSGESLRVGSRVFISHCVQIHDTNSHSLSASERHERFKELMTYGKHLQKEIVNTAAINIEDDVWIGFNCVILKGVRIGQGAIIGAGTLINHDIEPYAVVAGTPAKVIGKALV